MPDPLWGLRGVVGVRYLPALTQLQGAITGTLVWYLRVWAPLAADQCSVVGKSGLDRRAEAQSLLEPGCVA